MQMEKPTLLYLLLVEKPFTFKQIAKQAELPYQDVYNTVMGVTVTKEIAEKVMAAYSELTGVTYTLDTVDVKYIE